MATAFWIIFGIVATIILGGMIYERLRKRRAVVLLHGREPLDSADFGRTYFGDSPERAALAARIRDILSANLRLPLNGLRPEDRLDEDLYVELLANPDLFLDLEYQLEIDTSISDWAAFEARIRDVSTFRDLVHFVETSPRKRLDGKATDLDGGS